MSLTSILKLPETRTFLAARIRIPSVVLEKTLKAPPRLQNASRVGTAFDYAIRFGFQARGHGVVDGTVAESAIDVLPQLTSSRRLLKTAKEQVEQALFVLRRLSDSPQFGPEAAEACMRLASIDPIYRAGYLDDIERPSTIEETEDLCALYGLIPWSAFVPVRRLLLNPTFGEGSVRVGGADADLVLDSCLIDIKTVKQIQCSAQHIRQLVGYALLANRFGIDSDESHFEGEIEALGLYFSRTGQLVRFALSEAVHDRMREEVLEFLLEQGLMVSDGEPEYDL